MKITRWTSCDDKKSRNRARRKKREQRGIRGGRRTRDELQKCKDQGRNRANEGEGLTKGNKKKTEEETNGLSVQSSSNLFGRPFYYREIQSILQQTSFDASFAIRFLFRAIAGSEKHTKMRTQTVAMTRRTKSCLLTFRSKIHSTNITILWQNLTKIFPGVIWGVMPDK